MAIDAFYQDLISAVSLAGPRAVLRVATTYQPAGGAGSKVFPPTYPKPPQRQPEQDRNRESARADDSPYVLEARVVDGEHRENVLLDSTPSQANRAEEALLRARRAGTVRLPLLQVKHDAAVSLVLTSLEFPHRYADAYLRDSLLDGVLFDKTELGRSFLASTAADATALYAHDPGSLVFGAWNSHRKGQQQRFPRIYASEILGWDPVVGARNAGRLDPLNLQGAQKQTPDGGWDYSPVGEKAKGQRLSEIGHGNIAPNTQHGGVTISSARRSATVSLAALDRIGFGAVSNEAALAARASAMRASLLGLRGRAPYRLVGQVRPYLSGRPLLGLQAGLHSGWLSLGFEATSSSSRPARPGSVAACQGESAVHRPARLFSTQRAGLCSD